MPKVLRLILGDQLNEKHSWFSKVQDDVMYCMMELKQETGYVRHHIQKIMAFFDAMRNFSCILEERGHQVKYIKISDSSSNKSFGDNLNQLITKYNIERFEYMLPDEYRLDMQLSEYCKGLNITSSAFDTEHFMCTREQLKEFFATRKTYILETFYRDIRRRHDILMDDGEPMGGKWNYDHQNRESLKRGEQLEELELADRNLESLFKEIKDSGIEYIGRVEAEKFKWISRRDEGLEWLDYWLDKGLPKFGKYQDAMHNEYKFLFHSRLSFLLNAKLISPKEIVERTLEHWDKNKHIEIASVEGFVRQIIGWREYMRGIYWAHMPNYSSLNFFNHRRNLPAWFWTGQTKMNCMHHAISQSLDDAYAHHIQRLMVTGNFALLAGVNPDEIDAWYLGIYIDAIEWVEITNTRGMSQFADGGIVGTKPYVSSAAYIHKMSNYCSDCHYNHKEKTGERACPFNSMYWRFYELNRDKLAKNPRISMMYRTWDKMDDAKKQAYLDQAESYLESIEEL